MSINSKRGPSTGPANRHEELSLFVDRHRYVREFIEVLNTQPAREQVLFFYGVGGVGKSLLLWYLRENGCRMVAPNEWTALNALGDEEFRAAFEHAPGTAVPMVMLDFSAHKVGDDPCDPFHGPLMIRSQLGELGFRFPRFDFAVVLFAQRKHYSSEKIAALLPRSDAGVTAELLDFLVENSKVASVASFVTTKLFDKYGSSASLLYAKKRAPEEVVAEIYHLDVDTELIPRLPRLLAEDINDELTARASKSRQPAEGKLCLLFDTHDAFWAEQHFGGSESQRNGRDEWFRALLANLDLDKAQVAVTGRERPRWPSAVHEVIPAEYLRMVAVGDLDPEDASLYLEQRGIADTADRLSIITALSTETGLHPLSLGLAADLVGRGGDLGGMSVRSLDFADIGPELLDRLLSYLPGEECLAITALGACRSFDRDLYLHLGRTLAFNASATAFEQIKQLSFIIPAPTSDRDSYKIHTVIRKSLIDSTADLIQAAHQSLAQYYQQLTEKHGDAAHLEQLFHISRLVGRREEAAAAWLRAMDTARADVDMQQLMCVLGLEDEMTLESWRERSQLALSRKALYSSQGRDDDSQSVLQVAIAEGRRQASDEADRLLLGELLLQLGWVERYRTRAEGAVSAFREAVDLFRHGSPATDHMRGRLYFGWSGVPADAGDTRGSRELLESASRAYGYALRRTMDEPQMRWISDASFTETCLTHEVGVLDGPEAAEPIARRAVDLAEQASAMAPDDVRGLVNLESAYAALSQCLVHADAFEALRFAELSLEVCGRQSSLQRGWGERPLQRLLARAALRQQTGDTAGAQEDEGAAIAAARDLAERQPRHRYSQFLLARASQLAAERLTGAAGEALLDEARSAATQALVLAPGWHDAQVLSDALR